MYLFRLCKFERAFAPCLTSKSVKILNCAEAWAGSIVKVPVDSEAVTNSVKFCALG